MRLVMYVRSSSQRTSDMGPAECHDWLLMEVELDSRKADCGEDPQCVFKSRPLGKLGWTLAIFDDDLNFKLATPKLTVRLAISVKKQES